MKINLLMKDWNGWKCRKVNEYYIWFNGYLLNKNIDIFINNVIALMDSNNSVYYDFDKLARDIQGSLSFLITDNKKLFCFVDRIKSIPLFYSVKGKKVNITNHPPYMLKNSSIDCNIYNQEAALEMSMSGYTIGSKTLCSELLQLCAGELLIVDYKGFKLREYYRYSPWKVKYKNKFLLKKELTEVSKQVLEDMVKNIDGRQIVIPLSAGNDSRFIASGLKELGVKDVFCFSYGLNNNFEVKTAEKIAKHLRYPWIHVPLSIHSQKHSFKEGRFKRFWEFTDNLSNAPILIDYSAVKALNDSGKISNEAIFVNGNSGDFITGGHMINNVQSNKFSAIEQLTSFMIDKHYSLWDCLKTTDNVDNIKSKLKSNIVELINKYNLNNSYFSEIGESIEWHGRQSKIVVTTQRSYEFYGYGWRLPMWDPIYMDFWESVEKKFKINQSLYIETLLENNWGGVWENINVNNFAIASNKLRMYRNFSKLFFIFSDKKTWNRFDKRIFSYYYDDTAATAIIPYYKAIFDTCGARNRNSWIIKKYLNNKGIDIV